MGREQKKRNDGGAGGERRKKISLNQKNVIIFLAEIVVLRRELMIHTKSIVMKDHEILGKGLSKDRSQNLEVAPCEFSSTIFKSRRKSSTICLKVLISFQNSNTKQYESPSQLYYVVPGT